MDQAQQGLYKNDREPMFPSIFHRNGLCGKILTKTEPMTTFGFTSRLPYHVSESVSFLLLQLTTCLEDHNQTTRLVSCKALQRLLLSCKDSFTGNFITYQRKEKKEKINEVDCEFFFKVTSKSFFVNIFTT